MKLNDSLRDLKDKELLSRQKVTEMVGQGIGQYIAWNSWEINDVQLELQNMD